MQIIEIRLCTFIVGVQIIPPLLWFVSMSYLRNEKITNICKIDLFLDFMCAHDEKIRLWINDDRIEQDYNLWKYFN